MPPRVTGSQHVTIEVPHGLGEVVAGHWVLNVRAYGHLAVHRVPFQAKDSEHNPCPRLRRGRWHVTHIRSGRFILDTSKVIAEEIAQALGAHPWWETVSSLTPIDAAPAEIRAVLAEVGQLERV